MKEFTYVIKDELGIHARPAGLLVKAAGALKSEVKLAAHQKEVDAKRIMGVMSLGVKNGEEVKVIINGEDEEAGFEALQTFFAENL